MEASKVTHQHYKLYKPYGYLSQFQSNAKHEQKKKFLGKLYDFAENTMAIGRLDKNSEGLLLLTTDGQVSYDICSRKVDKEYYVQLDGEITEAAIERLKKGVEIGFKGIKYNTLPCKVTLLKTPELPATKQKIRDDRHGPTSWISVIINEGKFRQVRKMTSAVGFPTLRLVRVRVGTITLDGLLPGTVKEMDNLL